jgi:hypothetical protein
MLVVGESVLSLAAERRSVSATVERVEPRDEGGTSWVLINLRIEDGGRLFTTTDPFLTVEEVEALMKFVNSVTTTRRDEVLTFTEPSFSIVHLLGLGRIVLLLTKELQPDWSDSEFYTISFPIWGR